jgi:hypothetical protein
VVFDRSKDKPKNDKEKNGEEEVWPSEAFLM